MRWLAEPFQYEFMQRALLAGVLSVIAASVIGTWVVVRGLSFLGDALAHGVLPGVSLAFLLGIDLTAGAFAGALVMVAGIALVRRRTQLTEDTAIGLLFVGMLALGVVIISRAQSSGGDLTDFLFGNLLGVTSGDVTLVAVTALVVIVGTVALYRPFLALSFNWDKAASLGMRPGVAHVAMLVLITIAIVAAFRSVGTLLVFGLLVAPPATAQLVVRRVPAMLTVAPVIGSFTVVAGLEVSYHAGTAPGATIAGLSVGLFFAVLLVRDVVRGIRNRATARAAAAGTPSETDSAAASAAAATGRSASAGEPR